MENQSVLSNPNSKNSTIYESNHNREMISPAKPSFSPDNFSLTAEGGINFLRYLKRFDLSMDTDLVMLSSNSHYYFDENELENVKTLVNLKKLNLIKDLDTFLHNLIAVLPADVNFIGCFSDSKNLKENGFLSGLSTRFGNFLDSRTDHNMNKKDVSELLEKHGLKIIDMTEISGLTFFYSQNAR